MSPHRFVQNFSRRRALIVTNDTRACETLISTSRKLGLDVQRCEAAAADILLLLQSLDPAQDILFIDGDLNCFQELFASPGFALPPAPVIGMVGVEAPSRLRALMQVGATAFLSKPVHTSAVFSALYLSVNEFEQKATLRRSVEELERRRRARRHVIKAVALVMKSHALDDEGAFTLLRKESMRARMSLESYCEYVAQRSAAHHRRDAVSEDLPLAADRSY
ncbi:MAG: ANTAR domain-containing protein [Shinella sp.]|nr:ANTAR domain-containing protein [Shinella sp.]